MGWSCGKMGDEKMGDEKMGDEKIGDEKMGDENLAQREQMSRKWRGNGGEKYRNCDGDCDLERVGRRMKNI